MEENDGNVPQAIDLFMYLVDVLNATKAKEFWIEKKVLSWLWKNDV